MCVQLSWATDGCSGFSELSTCMIPAYNIHIYKLFVRYTCMHVSLEMECYEGKSNPIGKLTKTMMMILCFCECQKYD